MGLKISKQIEIQPSQKIGRNEPCPCGSGKKYKKCCLKAEQEYLKDVGRGQTSRLVDWVMDQSFFQEALEKRIKEFFGNEKFEEPEFHGLIEALIFEEKINGKKPLERFIESASLSDQEKLIYQSWLEKSFFSIFEVTEVNLGKSLKLKDLVREQDYLVLERIGTYQIEKGDILAARLLPFQESWTLGGGLSAKLAKKGDENYWLRRNLKNIPFFPNLELDFIKVFYGKKEILKKPIEKFSYEEIKEILADLLKEHQISYQIKELEKLILEDKIEPEKVIRELSKKTRNREELEEWIDIVYHYWKSHPKFKTIREPGPKEKILVGQMMTEFNQMMMEKNLEKLSAKEIDKLSEEFSERWLNTPQKELEGKSPKEVIMEERTSCDFKEEPKYKLSFTPIPTSFPPQEEAEWVDKYNLATRLMTKEYRFLEALELFSQLYPKIDLLEDDKFRWYGKVAICLINLGEIELGKRYLEKSLELNPNYDVSLKNLKLLNEPQNLEKIKNRGKQELFYSLLEKELIFPIPESQKENLNQCQLLQDVITFLGFLAENPAPVSLKQRLLRFKDVLVINKKLIQPDPEIVKIGKTSFPYRYEWQMPKIRFLHLLCLAGKLVQEKKNKLVLSLKGEKFLTEDKEKQFSRVFSIWFIKLDWKSIEEIQWRPNTSAPLVEVLQIQSWQILETLKKFREKKFNRREFLDGVFPEDKDDKKEKFIKGLSLFFLNRAILEYLIWANIIRPEEKTKKGLFAEYDKFFLTPFGLSLINSIQKEMNNAIPSLLKNLV